MGQQSILHAVKVKPKLKLREISSSVIEEDDEHSGKPLCETLTDSMFSSDESSRRISSGLEEDASTSGQYTLIWIN